MAASVKRFLLTGPILVLREPCPLLYLIEGLMGQFLWCMFNTRVGFAESGNCYALSFCVVYLIVVKRYFNTFPLGVVVVL